MVSTQQYNQLATNLRSKIMPEFHITPHPEDNSKDIVLEVFAMDKEDEWWLTEEGEYKTAAGLLVRYSDTDNPEVMVMLEWPMRRNKSQESKTLRLLIHPDDAKGLSEVLEHTAIWIQEWSRRK